MATTTTGGTIHTHETLVASLVDVGIFKDTLFPTLALSSGLSVLAYAAGRPLDTVSTKDVIFPATQVAAAWWSAVGRRAYHYGLPLSQVLHMQSRPERLLLAGVTLWGGYKAINAEYAWFQRGKKDDPKYAAVKKQEGFWNNAILTHYLPDALVATIVALPYTAPFRHQGAVLSGYHPHIQSFSVGLFTFGFAMEVLADYQKDNGESDSIWSVLSNPKALGATLSHLAFPILLYSSDMLAPIELLGPLAFYLYSRYTTTSATPESDYEAAKDGAQKLKGKAEDAKDKAEEAADDAEGGVTETEKEKWEGKAKSGAEDAKQKAKKEALEVKDSVEKVVKNQWFLGTVAFGVVVGVIEQMSHGHL